MSQPSLSPPQMSVRAVILSIVLAMILAAANTYLGLFAGLTIASAIPAAVVSMGILGALGRAGILENNIVSTGASAGCSIASGIIFTLPALVFLGFWKEFDYWWVVAIGFLFTLARFSEAFLVLRAVQGGLALAWTPLVLLGMSLVYTLAAYPLGKLSDSVGHRKLLAAGLALLIGADLALAQGTQWGWLVAGIALWGLHMGMTQGLLARMVADTAPAELRGTAFGVFNLASGVTLFIASAAAGAVWERFGATQTFLVGAAFGALALLLLALRPSGSMPTA